MRKAIKEKYYHAGIAEVDIERVGPKIRVIIHTARPGIIIGRGGKEIESLKAYPRERSPSKEVYVDIREVDKPELNALLVGEGIAVQLEKRIAYRRAMRKAVDMALKMGAKGIKVMCSGRLGGVEIARTEWYLQGPAAPADPPGRHRLRLHRGLHDLRPDRHQGLDLPGRRREAEDDLADGGGRGDLTMLMPKKVKFRKSSAGRMRGKAERGGDPLVRRVRPAGPRAVLADRPPDRGRPHHHHPLHEAARQALDPDLPLEARDQEADRGPHGQGQGRPGVLGRRRPARPDPVRARGRRRRSWRREAMRLAAHKLPIKTRFISREARELR